MRSFSKCFDPRVDDAIVEDKDGIGQAAAVKGGKGEFLHEIREPSFSYYG